MQTSKVSLASGKIACKIILLAFCSILFHQNTYSQISILKKVDDVSGGVSKAARKIDDPLSKVDDAGRTIKDVAASSKNRDEFGISFEDSRMLALKNIPENTVQYYVGLKDGKLIKSAGMYSADFKDKLDFTTKSTYSKTLRKYLEEGNPIHIEYIVEEDCVNHWSFNSFYITNLNKGKFYLANYDGHRWPLRKVPGRREYFAEVGHSLVLPLNDNTLESVLDLGKNRFSSEDLKVVSFLDKESDADAISLFDEATINNGSYRNCTSKKKLLKYIKKKKNKVIIISSHVEGEELVIRGLSSEKIGQVAISELMEAAEEKGNVLVFLGCETAQVSGTTGQVGTVLSTEVKEAIRRAIEKDNYLDFFSSLGTESNPLVLSTKAFGGVKHVVAHRKSAKKKETIKIVSVAASLKMARTQSNNTKNSSSEFSWLTIVLTIGSIAFILSIVWPIIAAIIGIFTD